MIKKYENFEKLNESVVEDMVKMKQLIDRTGHNISIHTQGDRIIVRLGGNHVMDVDNNMRGAQTVITFMTGVLIGIGEERKKFNLVTKK